MHLYLAIYLTCSVCVNAHVCVLY